MIGYAGADWEFGISSTLRYRNWSLSFDIAGRVGGVIRSDLNARMIEAGTHKLTAAPECRRRERSSRRFCPWI